MKNSKGSMVISLDFELLWGVRDKKTIESYGKEIEAVKVVIPKLLELFNEYDIKCTFSTVGFLFAKSKKELVEYIPSKNPGYLNQNLSPYNGHLELVQDSAEKDSYHFAPDLIERIASDPKHSIGTHTFSHYYCLEPGQTLSEFEADIIAAKKIAEKNDIPITSIVFPRNQCNKDYLNVCKTLGIPIYRGNENNWAFEGNRDKTGKGYVLLRRIFRGLDAYINIFGHHCYSWSSIKQDKTMYNIASSRLLRAYSKKLSFLEFLKIHRVKRSMKYAAKNGLIYHLWWHPHNFGADMDKNFESLKKILSYHKDLNKKYGFASDSMESLVKTIQQNG